jgi:uncharacterized membrane protein
MKLFQIGKNLKNRMRGLLKMKREQILPTVLMIIDIGAAIGYVPCGNWRMVVYWIAAAILTFTVTW